MPTARVLTLGYADRPVEEFVLLLRRHRVTGVADVRSLARSRKYPDYDRGRLVERLNAMGVPYHAMSELGGKRKFELPRSPNRGLRGAERAYADYMQSEAFAKGFRQLLALAKLGPVVLLCAEPDWKRCHRRFLADALASAGADVVHLDADGQAAPHAPTPRMEIRRGVPTYPPAGEQLSLF